MTVNLTVMLVLATMFISISSSLPVTSYVKMIDVWLLFSLMVPFVEVLLHTWKVLANFLNPLVQNIFRIRSERRRAER